MILILGWDIEQQLSRAMAIKPALFQLRKHKRAVWIALRKLNQNHSRHALIITLLCLFLLSVWES